MSDETLESGQSGGGGAANSETSQAPGGQQTSTVDAETIVNALKPLLQPWLDSELQRRLQGEKDRRISKIERRLETTEGALARFVELVEGGMKPDQAQQQLRLESVIEFVESLKQRPNQSAALSQTLPQGKGEGGQATEEAALLLKEAGLESDPEWVGLVAKGFTDAHAAVKAAANLIVRRSIKAQRETTNPAVTIQPGGGSLPEQTNEELARKYREEILAARGKGNETGRAIRQKYRELGLNV